jgi:hypothetical protein
MLALSFGRMLLEKAKMDLNLFDELVSFLLAVHPVLEEGNEDDEEEACQIVAWYLGEKNISRH